MGTFADFLTAKKISPKQIAITSKRIETEDEASRVLQQKRWAKRYNKENAGKKYAELDIGKPVHLGRGVSEKLVVDASKDVAVSRKARTKIVKAVNVILAAKKDTAVDHKALFEGTKARAGKKPVDPKAAAKK